MIRRKPWAGRKAPKQTATRTDQRRAAVRAEVAMVLSESRKHLAEAQPKVRTRTPEELAPLMVSHVQLGESVLYPRAPMQLEVQARYDGAFLVAAAPIGLHACVLEREDLLGEVEDEIRFLWTEYAKAPESKLAIRLAARLREMFEERPVCAPQEPA